MLKRGNSEKEMTPSSQTVASDHQMSRDRLRWALESQAIAIRILSLLNRQAGPIEAIGQILDVVKEFTDFEAIGIRLRQDKDFPYFVTKGFPKEFVDSEISVLAFPEGEKISCVLSEIQHLQCICGMVISGRTVPSLDCFTRGGSFWTNSMSDLLAALPPELGRIGLRGKCNAWGYESVALIPLRSDLDIIGLLQLNDSRRDRFVPEMISFLEGIGTSIGIVLARASAEEALRRVNEELELRVAERTRELFISNQQLNQEIKERKAAQKALQTAHAELEKRVEERTEELRATNTKLLAEISERKATEQALRASEENFRTIFEESPIGIELYDGSGKLISVNKACLNIFGISDESQVYGFDLFKDPNLPEEIKNKLLRGETVRHEVLFDFSKVEAYDTKKTGIIYLDVLINPLFTKGPKAECSGYLVHVRDVTERKRAEEALRLSESRFREIYENSAVMMHSINRDGYILNVNKKWLEELGYTREEVIGRRLDMIMAPESAEYAFSDVLPKFWEEGKITNVEYKYVRKDGSLIDVLLDSVVMKDPVWGLISLSVIRNITAQKRAERELLQSQERFRAVFEGAGDCIFIKDHTLRYSLVNPAMAKLLGMMPSQIIGLRASDLYGEDAGKHIHEVEQRVLAGESLEEEHTRPINGVDFTFLDVRMPLKNAKDEIIGVFGISRNITERKKVAPQSRIAAVDYPSPAMASALAKARYAATADTIVLLLGESGSGKDYMARWIHDHSKRAKGPFFAINCAAVPHELAESELFGHEAGAFTGARGRKRGLLELAEGGTLLLNEIGELSLPLQSKLLTFLDTRSFLRVGGEKSISVNARLIAATHRDLEEEVAKGRFLQALFFRLNVFTIRVPPLRERIEDLSVLVREFMSQLAAEMQLTEIPVLDAEAMDVLSRYHWPGNVRELRNVLERALMLSQGGKINLSLIHLGRNSGDWSWTVHFPVEKSLHDITGELIYLLCCEALRRSGGSKKAAAEMLGISRDSFYRYMKGFGSKRENKTDN